MKEILVLRGLQWEPKRVNRNFLPSGRWELIQAPHSFLGRARLGLLGVRPLPLDASVISQRYARHGNLGEICTDSQVGSNKCGKIQKLSRVDTP